MESNLLREKTAQADIIVKTEQECHVQFVRLRYAPSGFGFDARAGKEGQLIPKNGLLTQSWCGFSACIPRGETRRVRRVASMPIYLRRERMCN